MTTQRKTATKRSAKVVRANRSRKKEKRVVLFPTEPGTIPLEKIMAAIDAVRARRNKQ